MPRITAPYETTYRDATVYAAILPNGGLTALQILNMLECFEPVTDDTVNILAPVGRSAEACVARPAACTWGIRITWTFRFSGF